jgi:gamma-glutamyltranspeptidase/glutathione hydrolase
MDLVPGSGPLAAAVPGAVDAWLLLLRDKGTQTLAEILQPAIGYARDGHPLLERVTATVATVQGLFTTHWPTSAELWLAGGGPPAPGALFRNPALADTFERLVGAGRDAGGSRETQIDAARHAWGQGFVAQAVDAFMRTPHHDSSGEAHAGLVTGDDMAAFAATWEDATTLDWHGVTVAKTGPWGQGPALLQTLRLLEAYGGAEALDPSTAHGIHVATEAMKLAYADREAWYGDVDDVPLRTLLSSDYAAERARLIRDQAAMELRPGRPDGRLPRLPTHTVAAGAESTVRGDATTGEPTVSASGVTRGDTCHIDVVDRWGNMISSTPSGGWLQSSPTIPELGFALGSRLQMCWLEPGLASSLAPGRRPRTTLTPTLVLRDGRPVLACGSPGGDQQDQWQLIFLLRHLVQGQELQEAIDAPMWNTPAFPSSFWPRATEPGVVVVEDRLDPAVVDGLRGRGHEVRLSDAWSLGRMCAVTRDAETGVVSAAANPRGMQGYAVGR